MKLTSLEKEELECCIWAREKEIENFRKRTPINWSKEKISKYNCLHEKIAEKLNLK